MRGEVRNEAGSLALIPAILATLKAEIRKIKVQS
jgi:hypothetical protein